MNIHSNVCEILEPIPSFACIGRCGSYVQVSGSKIWQMERSCMCCQESGEREASVSLFCPKAKPGERKFRKVKTYVSINLSCLFQVYYLFGIKNTSLRIFLIYFEIFNFNRNN